MTAVDGLGGHDAATMRAVLTPTSTTEYELPVSRVPRPEPAAGEVLMRVAAAGVNRADLMQCRGEHPPPIGATNVLGLECSGVVVATGAGVSPDCRGQAVCALIPGGGYAEYVAVPAGLVMELPAGMTFEEGAALPEAAATAWHNVFTRGGLQRGEQLLVHAGTSAVGAMAIQVAAAAGAHVSATARTEDGLDFCRARGAENVYLTGSPTDGADGWSAGPVFDVVLDLLGGPYLSRNVAALRRRGRLVAVGLLSGRHGSVDVDEILRRDLTIVGSGLRALPPAEKVEIVAALRTHVLPLHERDALRLPIEAAYPLDSAAAAHARLEAGGSRGKVVLRIDTDGDVKADQRKTTP